MTFKEELIKNTKKVECPVEWICKRLNKIITVEENCVYYNGWICDCGYNVNDDDIFHKVTLWGFAEDVNSIVDFDKKVDFGFEKRVKPLCCECGVETNRCINGVFICKKCYGYSNGNGSKYFDKDVIRRCSFFDGVNTNFKLMICKGCDRLNYCKKIVRKEKDIIN